jgi:hypothetical protein
VTTRVTFEQPQQQHTFAFFLFHYKHIPSVYECQNVSYQPAICLYSPLMASKTPSVLALSSCIPVVSRDDDTSDVMGFGWCLIPWTEAVRKLMTIRVLTRMMIRETDPQRRCIGDTKTLTKMQQEEQIWMVS